MIWIFNCTKASAASCDTYDELFQYLMDIENLKLSGNSSEVGSSLFERLWSFTFFTPQQVSAINANTQQPLLTKIVKEAHEKEVGCIPICHGDSSNSIAILVTPDIDMEAIKKQWCLEYCNAYDFIVVENIFYSQDSA